MKGPYERSKYDFHRVWECPKCNHRERTTGQATYAFCTKKQNGILCDSPMKIADDEPRLRTHAAHGKDNSNPRTVEPSTTDTKRNRTPNRLSPTGELKSDDSPVETLEPVKEVAVIEAATLPALELPRVAPRRTESDDPSKESRKKTRKKSRQEPPKSRSSSPSAVKTETDQPNTSGDLAAADSTSPDLASSNAQSSDPASSDPASSDPASSDAPSSESAAKASEKQTPSKKKRRGRRRNNRGGDKK